MGKIIQFDEARKRSAESRKGDAADYAPALNALEIYALKAFCRALADLRRHERVQLPDDFMDIMQDPNGVLPLRVYQKLAALPVQKRQMIIFDMVSAAHDGWARDNPQFFFDSQQSEGQFLFLRIELCGVSVYHRFLDDIATVIRRLGLETPHMALEAEEAYRIKRHQFVCEHNLSNANLAEYIEKCGEEYMALDAEISAALRKSPVLANHIASQVILRAPLGGIEFC